MRPDGAVLTAPFVREDPTAKTVVASISLSSVVASTDSKDRPAVNRFAEKDATIKTSVFNG